MGTQLFKIAVAGEHTHFASSKEVVKVDVKEDPPADMKLKSLTFLVVDADRQLVYREVWPGSSVPGDLAATTQKNDAGAPPSSFTWNGLNNQVPKEEDDKGGEHDVYATPLASPYSFRVVAELEKGEELQKPPEDIQNAGISAPCNAGEEREESEELAEELRPAPTLESLIISCRGGKSKSHTLVSALAGELPITDLKNRFCFALGKEEAVEICWKIANKGEAKIATGKLELFSSKHPAALWSYALDSAALVKEKLTHADWDLAKQGLETYFDKLLLLKDAPFKLKLTLEGDEVKAGLEVAWTYVDVVVSSMELFWGSAKSLSRADAEAPTEDAAFKDLALKEEVLLLSSLKGQPEAADPDSTSLDDLRGEDDTAGLVKVDPDAGIALELRSNLFYQRMENWADGWFGSEFYPRCWGRGPRLPVFARLKVRDSSGQNVEAPEALPGTQVVWDWHDPCFAKEAGLETEAFMTWAFHHVAQDAARGDGRCDDDSPRTSNCHRIHGGKVGTGAARVFPRQPGCEGEVADDQFPFKVEAFPTRSWAALSDVYAGDDERFQCMSGVIFQPSRIAGDTYRVRAYLFTGDQEAFRHEIDGQRLWEDAESAGLCRATIGSLEVWRRVDILRYYPKNADLPGLNMDLIHEKLAGGRVKLYMPPDHDAKAVAKMFDTGAGKPMRAVIDAEIAAHGEREKAARFLVEDQADNGFQLQTKTITEWSAPALDHALTELNDDAVYGAGTPARQRVQAAIATNATIWTVHDHLADAELDALDQRFLAYFQLAANQGTDMPQGVAPARIHVTSSVDNAGGIPVIFSGNAVLGDWYKKRILAALTRKYMHDPANLAVDDGPDNLVGRSGLHLFHFANPMPTFISSKGSVFQFRPNVYGGADADAGKQGLVYFSAEPATRNISINATDELVPLGGDRVPGRLSISLLGLDITAELADDARYREEMDAVRATMINAAAFRVLENVAHDAPVPTGKNRHADPDGTVWERSFDLWNDYVHIGVKGAQQADVQAFVAGLVELKTIEVHEEAAEIDDERCVYVSRFHPFDADRSLRVHFGWRTSDITKKDGNVKNSQRVLDWMRALFSRTPRAIGDLYVYHRNTQRGGARAAAVHNYIAGVLRYVDRRVQINSPVDIRPIAQGDVEEQDIYVSLQEPYDEAHSTRLHFPKYSASIYKEGISTALREFAARTPQIDRVLPPVFVYYRDTDRGRHRKQKVANYLFAVYAEAEQPIAARWSIGAQYDLIPLATHEIAHALFLQHAPPETGDAVGQYHVRGYNCLMNYDPSGLELCGICMLQLRGWDLSGGAASPTNGPAYDGPAPVAPEQARHDAEQAPPPPPPAGPDHTVGHVLDDAGLVTQPQTEVIGYGYQVTAVNVFPQGGAQGGLNTCGFHSIKNCMYLQHYVQTINTTAGAYRRNQLAEQLRGLVLTQPDAATRFNEIFLDGGGEDHPGDDSWLGVATAVGNLPQGADQSIGAEHQEAIVARLAASTCRLPTDDGGRIPAASADGIAVSLDFGVAGDFVLYGGAEVPKAIKALYEMQEPDKRTRSFTCGVGPHFIAITACKYEPPGGVELIVADSLGNNIEHNMRAIRGISAWIHDVTFDLAVATFELAFYDDWSNRLPHVDNLLQPNVGESDLAAVSDWVSRFDAGSEWLRRAGMLDKGAFTPFREVMRAYLAVFPARLQALVAENGEERASIEGQERTRAEHAEHYTQLCATVVDRLAQGGGD